MSLLANPFHTKRQLSVGKKRYTYYSLPSLEEQKIAKISKLPVSIRVMLESLLRHCDGKKVTELDVLRLAQWKKEKKGLGDVPFVVSRVILQDFTGVPLLVDLAAMRDAASRVGADPGVIEPLVPVDLVIDHSVQVDRAGTSDAFAFNLEVEQRRNIERYSFLKWGQEAFKTFQVVPPGIGIVHQVNLEHLATVVTASEQHGETLLYPDTLVGTDSHTTMVNGLGVVGWGVGGIEAEAAMLGQPVAIEMPEVIGVLLEGQLHPGVTATDLTLAITELLRREKVVGKFVEFFGEGAASLSVTDRATIGNMAPEYGATIGFFPVDDKTLEYLALTGRSEEHLQLVKEYLQVQNLYGIPRRGEVDFSKEIHLDLSSIKPCVAGPKRPQDRICLSDVKKAFHHLIKTPVKEGGYGKESSAPVVVHSDGKFSLHTPHAIGGKTAEEISALERNESEMVMNRPLTCSLESDAHPPYDAKLTHGSVVIAAITSCTNTSNPNVMLAAGLLAKKAVEKGLKVGPLVKTSLAPGSRVVTDYLEKAGLQQYLNALGFQLVAYGCTTCIGNSGPLEANLEQAIKEHDVIAASVLSGNRNFEARIHSAVKANFLMSPPLVVAFALAGKIDIDFDREPIGKDTHGKPVFLSDIWPSDAEIKQAVASTLEPTLFKKRYAHVLQDNPSWSAISVPKSSQYHWDPKSTYIQSPPFFEHFSQVPQKLTRLENMRCLAIFGDSVTTDHISPAGSFRKEVPAGKYLLSLGVKEEDFNSYGSRRGNDRVMVRGTFANVRIRNQMAGEKEGGFTKVMPGETLMPIYDASLYYKEKKTPLILFAGKDYGMGSSRDWAAKGTALLGVKVVVATSFERIHRSNLIGMGVLPLEFLPGESHETHQITGEELFTLHGLEEGLKPRQKLHLDIEHKGARKTLTLISRIDTPTEAAYYTHGGILPFVLRDILVRFQAPK